jgi:Skp family chaperone for outer membrane proteins
MGLFPSEIGEFQKYESNHFDSCYRSPIKNQIVDHLFAYKSGNSVFALRISSNDPYDLQGPFPFTQDLEGYHKISGKATFHEMVCGSGIFTTNQLVSDILTQKRECEKLDRENIRLRTERDESRKNLKENIVKMDEVKSELDKLRERNFELERENIELQRKLDKKDRESDKRQKYYEKMVNDMKNEFHREIGKMRYAEMKERETELPLRKQLVIEYPENVKPLKSRDLPFYLTFFRGKKPNKYQVTFAIVFMFFIYHVFLYLTK